MQLTAGLTAGLVPNAARPAELQAWTSDLLAADYTSDFGDRCEPLRAVELAGPATGTSRAKW